MGNGFPKLTACLSAPPTTSHHTTTTQNSVSGYAYSYERPPSTTTTSSSTSKLHHHPTTSPVEEKEEEDEEEDHHSNANPTTTFHWISGASVSANTSTPPSSTLPFHHNLLSSVSGNASTPPSSTFLFHHSLLPSATIGCSRSFSSTNLHPSTSGPLSLSGPLLDSSTTTSSLSGPIVPYRPGFFSGPLEPDRPFFSEVPRLHDTSSLPKKGRTFHGIRRAISRTIVRGHNSIVAPITGVVIKKVDNLDEGGSGNVGGPNVDDIANLHWAEGKAGEDCVHVVVSEQHELLFVGIYDGFNGPDAPEYLLSNLYSAVREELKGLLWNDEEREPESPPPVQEKRKKKGMFNKKVKKEEKESSSRRNGTHGWRRNTHEEEKPVDHEAVLDALSRAMSKTEDGFLGITDTMAVEHPELGLMGSCVLVMLMKGEDVYLMNVGDSRAIVARKPEGEALGEGEEEEDKVDGGTWLVPLQLTVDHSTCVEEEVCRIRREHPEDAAAVINGRVKGSLKVTRAFGAGFLKKPKWNNALLGRFRIDYVGSKAYITCSPFLHHRKLTARDRFLILSSDGLYQYFGNEEVVSELEYFVATTPDGDPAQHLVEESLSRAAANAGLDLQELLQIPQGDRRRYHDDISVVIISLEGRIWKSCL